MTDIIEQARELLAIAEKATPGPYYFGSDRAEECGPHASSGLALVDTGRHADWPIARLCKWNNAEWIAKSDPLVISAICRALIVRTEALEQIAANFGKPLDGDTWEERSSALTKRHEECVIAARRALQTEQGSGDNGGQASNEQDAGRTACYLSTSNASTQHAVAAPAEAPPAPHANPADCSNWYDYCRCAPAEAPRTVAESAKRIAAGQGTNDDHLRVFGDPRVGVSGAAPAEAPPCSPTHNPALTYVCREKDIVCGDRPEDWCIECPLRRAEMRERGCGCSRYETCTDKPNCGRYVNASPLAAPAAVAPETPQLNNGPVAATQGGSEPETRTLGSAHPTAAPAEAPQADDLLARIERAIDRITSGGAPMCISRDLTDADIVLADCRDTLAARDREIARLRDAWSRENDEISQTLGRALGYPRFCDDQKNFPGATAADGVCVGDHVAESLAAETAARIKSMQADNRLLHERHAGDNGILAARDARIRELHEALREHELIARHEYADMVCNRCGESWSGATERHAAGCLASPDAPQQEPQK